MVQQQLVPKQIMGDFDMEKTPVKETGMIFVSRPKLKKPTKNSDKNGGKESPLPQAGASDFDCE